MDNKAIIILSPPLSGSTALIDMLGAKVVFEDTRWDCITRDMTGAHYEIRQPSELPPRYLAQLKKIVGAFAKNSVWGIHNNRMSFLFGLFEPHISAAAKIKLIHVKADEETLIQRLIEHSENEYGGVYRLKKEEATAIVTQWQNAALACYQGFVGNKLQISTIDLSENTAEIREKLEKFVFDNVITHRKPKKAKKLDIDDAEVTG